MCNTYPRPRCSHHTHEKLSSELGELQGLLQEADEYKRTPKVLSEKIARQESRVELARRQFNCTKRGMEELEENLSTISPSADRLKYSYYQRSLTQAQEDALNHKTAGAVFDAYNDNIDPKTDETVQKAQQKRNSAAEQIAHVSNSTPHSNLISPLERQYDTSIKEERHATQKFLLRERGITHPVQEHNPLSASREVYAFVGSHEFGHLSKEFPAGCYTTVTDINVTPEGNFKGKIEGVKESLFPASTPFITERNT